MRLYNMFKNILMNCRKVFSKEKLGLQPRDILAKLIQEMERRKKYGIEEKAYVPNSYAIYLSTYDFEEISPFIFGIKDQLKNKLIDRVKKKGYIFLSSSLWIDVRGDAGLVKDQIVVESSFLKEKSFIASSGTGPSDAKFSTNKEAKVTIEESAKPDDMKSSGEGEHNATRPSSQSSVLPSMSRKESGTKIIEDKKTKLIDSGRVRLEIIKGDQPGEVINLKEGEYVFGRGQEAQILLEDNEDTISRRHFKLIVRNDRIRIKDLGSLNGTLVNEMAIEEAELQKGDQISVGNVLLKVA